MVRSRAPADAHEMARFLWGAAGPGAAAAADARPRRASCPGELPSWLQWAGARGADGHGDPGRWAGALMDAGAGEGRWRRRSCSVSSSVSIDSIDSSVSSTGTTGTSTSAERSASWTSSAYSDAGPSPPCSPPPGAPKPLGLRRLLGHDGEPDDERPRSPPPQGPWAARPLSLREPRVPEPPGKGAAGDVLHSRLFEELPFALVGERRAAEVRAVTPPPPRRPVAAMCAMRVKHGATGWI